ncbi:hypothetical protein TNCV_857561 [Trichonephila clavipes]|nr:hypothetical protein TNCV_857561 [Trichonephila clavipes]
MTSFGVDKVIRMLGFSPTFTVQGQIYHQIGSLFTEEEELLGVPLTPPKRVTHFPRLEEGNVPINTSWYGMFLGISRVLGESWTARRYPSADSSPIRKADCVSENNPLQNTEQYLSDDGAANIMDEHDRTLIKTWTADREPGAVNFCS